MNRKTCIIHIGMHKTGTSSIQKSLYASRAVMKKAISVNYYDLALNHTKLQSIFSEEPELRLMNIIKGFWSREFCRSNDSSIKAHLIRALECNDSDFFILSSEEFSEISEDEAKQFQELLQPYFDQIKIICYVRAPSSYVHSRAQQFLKVGATFNLIIQDTVANNNEIVDIFYDPILKEYRRNYSVRPSYQSRIDKFATVFGAKNVIIRDFTMMVQQNQNIIAEFMNSFLPRELEDGIIEYYRENQAISLEEAYLLEAINQKYPFIVNKGLNPYRARDITHYLSKNAIIKRKFAFEQLDLSLYAERIRDDVHWLEQFTGGEISYDITAPQIKTEGAAPTYDAVIIDMINDTALKAQNESAMRRFLGSMMAYDKRGVYRSKGIFNLINICSSPKLLRIMYNKLISRGKYEEAYIAAEKIIRMDPDNVDIRERLDQIKSNVNLRYNFSSWYA